MPAPVYQLGSDADTDRYLGLLPAASLALEFQLPYSLVPAIRAAQRAGFILSGDVLAPFLRTTKRLAELEAAGKVRDAEEVRTFHRGELNAERQAAELAMELERFWAPSFDPEAIARSAAADEEARRDERRREWIASRARELAAEEESNATRRRLAAAETEWDQLNGKPATAPVATTATKPSRRTA